MTRLLWPLSVLLICLPVAILASGVPLPFTQRHAGLPRPRPVPDGDRELAWLHTTTNGPTWERFVSGVARAQVLVPGLHVDDSAAFLDQTTAVPEVVLSMDGRPGKLRVRWYKLTSEANSAYWVQALADRDPAPLALIGGGSSDRALDLARALDGRQAWHGDRPLLLITTATADEVPSDVQAAADQLPPTARLIDVYDDRSFRFCFTNRQMADAVLDFVWHTPGLRPETFAATAPAAVASGMAMYPGSRWVPVERPRVFSVYWEDDPFSVDLHQQFKESIVRRLARHELPRDWLMTWSVPFSVGGFIRPNPDEARVAEKMLEELGKLPPQRSLLVLPTITQPARRLLRALADSPQIGRRLVAVTGDGIPVNAIYRDGDFMWPVNAMPVPLVLFTHNNPVGWDEPGESPAPPPGYELRPPNSTEDVLHFAELARVVSEAAYPPGDGMVGRADELLERLRRREPAFFDANGDRIGGSGEYVVALWPHLEDGNAGLQALPRATMEVWRRAGPRRWEHVRSVEIDQQSRTAARAKEGRRG